jgi:hypothetical protein
VSVCPQKYVDEPHHHESGTHPMSCDACAEYLRGERETVERIISLLRDAVIRIELAEEASMASEEVDEAVDRVIDVIEAGAWRKAPS